MKYLIVSMLCCLSVCFACQSVSSQTSEKCVVTVKDGKYEKASIGGTLANPLILGGTVLVKPKNFNREFMTKLARRLKQEYCEADEISVMIVDSKEYMGTSTLMDYARSKQKIINMRGFYNFDRKSGKDMIVFSTVRGNPPDEIQINLSTRFDKSPMATDE